MEIHAYPGSISGKLSKLMLNCSICLATGALVSCLYLLSWQIYSWLRYGLWPEFKFSDGLSYIGFHFSSTSWIGFNQVIVFLNNQPLWIGISTSMILGSIFLGCLSAICGIKDQHEQEAWNRKRWIRERQLDSETL